jgi:hypothetical protein
VKFYSGTEFHCGTPKWSRVINRLLNYGGAILLFSICIKKTPDWISGLVVLLAGHITERKEWETKRKTI